MDKILVDELKGLRVLRKDMWKRYDRVFKRLDKMYLDIRVERIEVDNSGINITLYDVPKNEKYEELLFKLEVMRKESAIVGERIRVLTSVEDLDRIDMVDLMFNEMCENNNS